MNYSDFKRNNNGKLQIGSICEIPDISQAQVTDPFSVFLGPHAENHELLSQLVNMALQHIYEYRQQYYIDDPKVITESIQATPQFQQASLNIQNAFSELLAYFLKHATPYFSLRYQGHMLWDNTLPAIAGYIAGMLHNPNNVSLQASTSTTPLAMLVGWDMCQMVGFPTNNNIQPWSHLTADGTVANLESLWAIREVRSLPFALIALLQSREKNHAQFTAAKNISIKSCAQKDIILLHANAWDLINLELDELLDIPQRVAELCEIDDVFDIWNQLIKYTHNATGVFSTELNRPVILTPSSKHYSWPKAAAITAYGHNSIIDIYVDADGRMDMHRLDEQLAHCLEEKIPIAMVVVVCGSTEESSVDNICEVLRLRKSYRKKGLDFMIHVDAAWGGYMLSVIRKDYQLKTVEEKSDHKQDIFLENLEHIPASDYVLNQLKHIRNCDTVTIDPHKWGYVQYPAGAVLYRNAELRRLTTFTSAYIGKSSSIKPDGPSVGIYGVEGSRPGASAAAVYMSHRCLRPSIGGYGKIISECLFNTRKFYARLLSLNTENLNFGVVPLPRLPAEKDNSNIEQQLEFIQQRILSKNRQEIRNDPAAMQLFRELGPDQNILDYGFNIRFNDGSFNSNLAIYNQLNTAIYKKFSMQFDDSESDLQVPFFVTLTTFDRVEYGDEFISCFAKRLGLNGKPQALHCLRSVVMDPYMTHTTDGSYFIEIMNLIRTHISQIIKNNFSEVLSKENKMTV